MSEKEVCNIFKKHIKHTARNALVPLYQIPICTANHQLFDGICKISISTYTLKHIYDKRPAQEFDLLLKNIKFILKHPDKIYQNKHGKRGSFCIVKQIGNFKYLYSLEKTPHDPATHYNIATCFRVEEKYLGNYELLWEWKGGKPSSPQNTDCSISAPQ